MKILVTGAKGFVGKNLSVALNNLKENKDRTRPNLVIDEVFEYDIDNTNLELEEFAKKADFVFNLAGVNRPKTEEDFIKGNVNFQEELLNALKKANNKCPIMISSTIQASLIGRYADGVYGKSKQQGENIFFDYMKNTGVPVYVYRFPNLFGKWCKPNYNSVVATFCNNIANDLPITVNDRSVEIEFLYIDDLINEMLDLLEGKEHRCNYDGLTPIESKDGKYCFAPITHKVTLGEVVDLLEAFSKQSKTLIIPEIPNNSFAKKLYSTYLTYLPKEKMAFKLKMNVDDRGSFTELLKTKNNGQISINISKPNITKGQHWH